MGLSMFFMTRHTLNPSRPKERKMIEYLSTLQLPLNRQIYLSNYIDSEKAIRDELNASKLCGQVGDITQVTVKNGDYIVSTEAMYWRKENHIHHWFVNNVQGGEDDCEVYPVTIAHIKELIATIDLVLKKKVSPEEALPTKSGFFFGSIDYDLYYYSSLRNTKRELKKLLKSSTVKNWTFDYRASW